MSKDRLTPGRIIIYLLGIFLVSLGIVLCKKCNLGISPISSIPYVLEDVVPLTFGNLTTLFHFANIALQMLLARKLLDPKLWLQVPLAFAFGWVIDWISGWVSFDGTVLAWQILALLLSVLFTALGMVCMISMDLIQNPPDGFVHQLSARLGRDLGTVKVCYDVSCVVISVVLGLLFLHTVKGFGVATIVSAIFVGKTVTWLKKLISLFRNQAKSQV
ncbi:MAG: YitT family protein [Candidatus Onthomonas sp.]